jgi:predicted dehydrogenase
MTLLIIGCGSIGTRHARNACSLGYDVVVCDPDIERAQTLAREVDAVASFADYREALTRGSNVDAAVIATPSAYHVEEALYLAEQGIPIFMEKPLATSTEGIAGLIELVKSKKLITMMGQSYRFHEGVLEMKKIIDSGAIGLPQVATSYWGSYLPDWHSAKDYRREYSAQKKLGGGAMFTLMSHTLDLCVWLFGDFVEYSGTLDRLGDLEIDVDDTATITGVSKRGVRIKAKNDFITKPSQHSITIVGTDGTLVTDLIAHTLHLSTHDGLEKRFTYIFDPNHRYKEELRYFVSLVARKEADPSLTIAHGARIVELMTDPRIVDTNT